MPDAPVAMTRHIDMRPPLLVLAPFWGISTWNAGVSGSI